MIDDPNATTVVPRSAARLASAGATHVGAVRKINEDSWFSLPDQGLWIVADGVGGASAGDWASQQTVAAFADFARPPDPPAAARAVPRHGRRPARRRPSRTAPRVRSRRAARPASAPQARRRTAAAAPAPAATAAR